MKQRPRGARVSDRVAQIRALMALVCAVAVVVAGAIGTAASTAAATPPAVSTMLPESASDAPGTASGTSLPGGSLTTTTYNAAKTGSGRWYWPIGTEDFQGWSGWLAPRGSYVHVAQDMPSKVGQPVYAIGAGTVWISRADAGGYGVNGAPGGCMIIVHKSADGREFRATYGHVSKLRYKAGAKVAAGAVIANVNGCAHLHFGIHPSTTYRDGNPYAGHVPASWSDHGGFADPVAYLKAHPRQVRYAPPVWPTVGITTTATPDPYGAADGFAYWAEAVPAPADGSAADEVRHFSQDLASGERRQLTDSLPPFDAVRYVTGPLAGPAVGFEVHDTLPVAALGTSHSTPAWGVPAALTLSLRNAAGVPIAGALVDVQRLTSSGWVNDARLWTRSDGTAPAAYTPASTTSLRLSFVPPLTQPTGRGYLAAASPALKVQPHVLLSAPAATTTAYASKSFTLAGYMTPRHMAARQTVAITIWQRLNDSWVYWGTVPSVNVDAGSRTRYVAAVSLPGQGEWRLQAVHPTDSKHAQTASRLSKVTVQ